MGERFPIIRVKRHVPDRSLAGDVGNDPVMANAGRPRLRLLLGHRLSRCTDVPTVRWVQHGGRGRIDGKIDRPRRSSAPSSRRSGSGRFSSSRHRPRRPLAGKIFFRQRFEASIDGAFQTGTRV